MFTALLERKEIPRSQILVCLILLRGTLLCVHYAESQKKKKKKKVWGGGGIGIIVMPQFANPMYCLVAVTLRF
jgi:hypothetical protein